MGKRRDGVWEPTSPLPPPLRRIQGPCRFKILQIRGPETFLPGFGSLHLCQEALPGIREPFPPHPGVGLYLQPLWPKEQEPGPLTSPLAQPGQQGKPGEMPGGWGAPGPWEQVSVLGDPGRRGGKKGPERRAQSERGKGGKWGVKEAKLGRSSRRLPTWQQGLSRQRVEAEPSPREGENGSREPPLLSPTSSPISRCFFLSLKTFSAPARVPSLFLCFPSHCKCHFLRETSSDSPHLGKSPGGSSRPRHLPAGPPPVSVRRSLV